jgi:hypothetical protein
MYFSYDLRKSFWLFLLRMPVWVFLHLTLFKFLIKTDQGTVSLLLLVLLNITLSFGSFMDSNNLYPSSNKKAFTRLVQYHFDKLNKSSIVSNLLFLIVFFICSFIAGFVITLDYFYTEQKSKF